MKVFNDDGLQQRFDKHGYVAVPFLNTDEVEMLKKAYFDTLSERKGNLSSDESDFDISAEISYDFTFIDKNPDHKRHVFEIISDAFAHRINEYLNDYEPIIANFIFKKEQGGEVPLHQNWAFVNEEKSTSVSIWVPLVDSDEANGTLQVVPGSHKRFAAVRGPMIPWTLDKIKGEIIKNHLEPMITKAGDAVILDDSIVHYSAPNKTPGLRLTIQLILKPKSVPCVHYHYDYKNSPEKITTYEVDQDFFMTFHPWKKPAGQKEIGTIPFRSKYLEEKEFIEGLSGPRVDQA